MRFLEPNNIISCGFHSSLRKHKNIQQEWNPCQQCFADTITRLAVPSLVTFIGLCCDYIGINIGSSESRNNETKSYIISGFGFTLAPPELAQQYPR